MSGYLLTKQYRSLVLQLAILSIVVRFRCSAEESEVTVNPASILPNESGLPHDGAGETTIEPSHVGGGGLVTQESAGGTHPSILPAAEGATETTITVTPESATETNTMSTTTTEATTTTQETSSSSIKPPECPDTSFCLNGGTCVVNELGQMMCICPEEFFGARCQIRNICKTIIADSLTGDQICARINTECLRNDRFFRCKCLESEYFIFKPNFYSKTATKTTERRKQNNGQQENENRRSPLPVTFSYSADEERESYEVTLEPEVSIPSLERLEKETSTVKSEQSPVEYLAACHKIDGCTGVRCRQMSEVCEDGACVCNAKLGYLRDPTDGLCKLLNPCLMPRNASDPPICGQARCVATLDQNLFKCVCPIGYNVVQRGAEKSTTQCVLIKDTVCNVPLLNKCQHLCRVDQVNNRYRCSCLPGYRSGTRPGLDDHMCFFDELFERPNNLEGGGGHEHGPDLFRIYSTTTTMRSAFSRPRPLTAKDYVFRVSPRRRRSNADLSESTAAANNKTVGETIIPYDTATETYSSSPFGDKVGSADGAENELIIKRIPRAMAPEITQGRSDGSDSQRVDGSSEMFEDLDSNLLSAQDRCNMYCEENKICVLERGSTDSYRCTCNRLGYVSVGDRCLDWCSAAEFNYRERALLNHVCFSGSCKPSNKRPTSHSGVASTANIHPTETDPAVLAHLSSWRPDFECECDDSPLLYQDPETKLCKLDFQAVVDPCLPGNEGYVDCVESKNAYCAVLYSQGAFFRALMKERPGDQDGLDHFGGVPGTSGGSKNNKLKSRLAYKNYVCVCSPEKKFLVDKPRQKARCVDECDLLKNECGRFNRMCRAATIDLEDFGRDNLIRFDSDGPQMNFKRTGCECLPGFNVGPTESLDFTLDDNNRFGLNSSNQSLGDRLSSKNAGHHATSSFLDSIQPNGPSSILPTAEHTVTKYIKINSPCMLDYDVVEFSASFKVPADFDPRWIPIKNIPRQTSELPSSENKLQPLKVTVLPVDNPSVRDDAPAASQADGKTGRKKVIKGDPYLEKSRDVEESGPSASTQHRIFETPDFMTMNVNELHKAAVFVAQCEFGLSKLSPDAYQECLIYRYWMVRKLRNHFADWRRVLTARLKETFDLMEGDIRLHVNKCEATITHVISQPNASPPTSAPGGAEVNSTINLHPGSPSTQIQFDPMDPFTVVDADIDCELTLHSANDDQSSRYSRKVLLEKQLQKFILNTNSRYFGENYYLMAPRMLIRRETFDNLAEHRRLFNPCRSSFTYCDKQTKCEMVDTVNFTCICETGYTPIGSRDLFLGDSRKEVCEDINECLFDICKDLPNSTCINEIGDYRCQCDRHFTGDNKRFCTHVCNTIPCKHGKCRLLDDHHAFCECEEGYKEADCSVQDPSTALRKANMIICGAIFASVLLLAFTLVVSLNAQLKKTKKKLRRLEAAAEAANMFDLASHQQPFRSRFSKVSVCS